VEQRPEVALAEAVVEAVVEGFREEHRGAAEAVEQLTN
jgi:hypothetical protein